MFIYTCTCKCTYTLDISKLTKSLKDLLHENYPLKNERSYTGCNAGNATVVEADIKGARRLGYAVVTVAVDAGTKLLHVRSLDANYSNKFTC